MKLEKTLLKDKQYSNASGYRARLVPLQFANKKFTFWEWAASHYDFAKSKTVLEVGCGTGDFWKTAQDKTQSLEKIILTDFSEGMLNTSRETLSDSPLKSKLNFQIEDVENLSFSDQTFDAVLAHLMLYHTKSPEKALSEIARVLKPKGWVGITTFNLNSQRELFELAHKIDSRMPSYAVAIEPFHENKADELLPQYFSSVEKYTEKVVTKVPHAEIFTHMMRLHPLSQTLEMGEDFYQAFHQAMEKIIAEKGFFEMTYLPVLYMCKK